MFCERPKLLNLCTTADRVASNRRRRARYGHVQYQFESKWDPDVSTGSEVHGRCQHPIAAGSGTGGFEGASGRADFKDEVTTGRFFYRGQIKLG